MKRLNLYYIHTYIVEYELTSYKMFDKRIAGLVLVKLRFVQNMSMIGQSFGNHFYALFCRRFNQSLNAFLGSLVKFLSRIAQLTETTIDFGFPNMVILRKLFSVYIHNAYIHTIVCYF